MNVKKLTVIAVVLALFATFLVIPAAADEATVVTTAEELAQFMANGGEAKLGTDIELTEEINAIKVSNDVDIVIDLAGHTLTDTKSEWYALWNGSLTVKDTVGGGQFNQWVYVCNAEFILEGGTVSYLGIYECASAVINGGTVSGVSMWKDPDCEPSGKANLTIADGGVVANIAVIDVVGDNFRFGSDPVADLPDGYSATDMGDGTWVIAVNALEGTGTERDPYLIKDVYDLKHLRGMVNGGELPEGTHVSLEADIDLGNNEWVPIGTSSNPFMGIFDGNEHTVSNLKCTGNTGFWGFFGKVMDQDNGVTGGVIRNLNIENATLTGTWPVGAVAANAYTGAIDNCHVSGTIALTGTHYMGGINGYGYASISNCSVIGGEGTNSFIKGEVAYIGGIAGFVGEGGTTIDNCTVKNVVISTADCYAGGIAGIAHQGNKITNNTVADVTVTAVEGAEMVGLFAGNSVGDSSSPAIITGNTMSNTSGTIGEKEINTLWGTDRESVVDGEPFGVTDEDGVTTFYPTLEEALDEAQTGETVILYGNSVAEAPVDVSGITLDGNGHTITEGDNFTGTSLVVADGEKTIIRDLTVDMGDNATAGVSVTNTTGTIENLKVNGSGNDSYGLVVDGAEVNVNGIQTSGNALGGIYADSSTGSDTSLTVNNATIEEENSIVVENTGSNQTDVAVQSGSYNKVDVAENAGMTITGGSFTSDVSQYVASSAGGMDSNGNFVVHVHDTDKEIPAVGATCTEPGSTAGKACSTCDKVMVAPETVKAAGHKLTKTDAKAATCTEGGNVEYHTCSVCKKTFDAQGKELTVLTTDALGHDLTKVEAKAASYTAAGNIEHHICQTCGKYYAADGKTEITKESVVIEQLSDNPNTGSLSVAPVIALLVINAIGAGAVVAGKKRFF